jgi:hypothetical protein
MIGKSAESGGGLSCFLRTPAAPAHQPLPIGRSGEEQTGDFAWRATCRSAAVLSYLLRLTVACNRYCRGVIRNQRCAARKKLP